MALTVTHAHPHELKSLRIKLTRAVTAFTSLPKVLVEMIRDFTLPRRAEFRKRFYSKAHTDEIYSLAISPDGKTIISCGFDRTVRLFDLHTGAWLGLLNGHSDQVNDVAILAPDTDNQSKWQVVAGSNDMTVRCWDYSSGDPGAVL